LARPGESLGGSPGRIALGDGGGQALASAACPGRGAAVLAESILLTLLSKVS